MLASSRFRPVLSPTLTTSSLPPLHAACFQRRKELDKEAIRAKRGAYQAYDDEEFEGEIGPGAKRKVV